MALTREELTAIANDFPSYTSELIPTKYEDQKAYFDRVKKPRQGATALRPLCEEPGCNAEQAKDYRFCKFCLEDKRWEAKWGKRRDRRIPLPPLDENGLPHPEKDQSLTKTYITMTANEVDDANMKKSMDILYPEKGE